MVGTKLSTTAVREYTKGIGQAVADRTINRWIDVPITPTKIDFEIPRDDDTSLDSQLRALIKSKGYAVEEILDYLVTSGDDELVEGTITVNKMRRRETWAEVSNRVSWGNALLMPEPANQDERMAEYETMRDHMLNGTILMSGRHLQHGDANQRNRPMEVFTNCLDGSTRILTMEHGAVEINKVAGKTVTVLAGDGVPREAMINAHGVQDLYDISFRSVIGGGGKLRHTVRATKNHRWKLRNGDITDALSVDDVIAPISGVREEVKEAVVHGILFGDGTAHKSRLDNDRCAVSQGRSYASIRVCKQDQVRDEIHEIFDKADYEYSTPNHADGDRVYYMGKFAFAKELPFTNDPDYIASFIKGWWLADGHKNAKTSSIEISTANEKAAQWLCDHAALGGYSVTSHRIMERTEGDGSYANGKALHVIRLRVECEWKVDSITYVGSSEVYCPEEPVTGLFTLANGLLTGNCATAAVANISFLLLLSGSGVGRCYDDDMMVVDYSRNMPIVVTAIDSQHPDVSTGEIVGMSPGEAKHFYAGREIVEFRVPDSREGWAQAIEQIDAMSYEKGHHKKVLLLDFSAVRERGAPIKGMQDRPASGPGALMAAIRKVAQLRASGMKPWRAALYMDHFLAECVLVGGARRAARMATKHWLDADIIEFINIKNEGFLWSSNNSVTVDKLFWELVSGTGSDSTPEYIEMRDHARRIYDAVIRAAYDRKTGEPGFINQDLLEEDRTNIEEYLDGSFVRSSRFRQIPPLEAMMAEIARIAVRKGYIMITNPCGEITIFLIGGYCVIADLAPYHAYKDIDPSLYEIADRSLEEAFRVTTRALIRTNLMDCLYAREVKRTNRIGVSLTGIFEFALKRYGFGFRDLINEEKSKHFWDQILGLAKIVEDEADKYSKELGLVVPHTNRTIKPAGTTSKLFSLSEGAHLPAMKEYIRWVQFRSDDPLIEEYRSAGYPVRELKTYSGTTIVGFPTQPEICRLAIELGLEEKIVTAAEATPGEQYQWLKLLEKYWIRAGQSEEAKTRGNQISYTLKYDPEVVGFEELKRLILENQKDVRCCTVMPSISSDASNYEYLPEETVTKQEYERVLEAIAVEDRLDEDVDLAHVDCGAGGCPIDFDKEEAKAA